MRCLHASSSSRKFSCPGTVFRVGSRRTHGVSHGVCHAEGGGLLGGLANLGKKVQGSLPIVGLISRLTSPEGGFDSQTYQEYARSWLEASNEQLNYALEDLEGKYGRVASRRMIYLLLWMIEKGLGLLKPTYFVLTARRLRASMDIESEMTRFETAMEEESKAYTYIDAPAASPATQMELAVDCIATCGLGLRDGMEIPAEDQKLLSDILSVIYKQCTLEEIQAAMNTRKDRQDAYSKA